MEDRQVQLIIRVPNSLKLRLKRVALDQDTTLAAISAQLLSEGAARLSATHGEAA